MNAPTAMETPMTSTVRFIACSRVGQITFLSSARVSKRNFPNPAVKLRPKDRPAVKGEAEARGERLDRAERAGGCATF